MQVGNRFLEKFSRDVSRDPDPSGVNRESHHDLCESAKPGVSLSNPPVACLEKSEEWV